MKLQKKKEASGEIHPMDIDAHWLQRKLSKYFDDATTSQQKAKEVLKILELSADNRECENRLVLLLGYDCFDFIKLLLVNKGTIVYCVRLQMAQSKSSFSFSV